MTEHQPGFEDRRTRRSRTSSSPRTLDPSDLLPVTARPPITVGEPEWDRGLWWMVLASGGLHLVAIGAALAHPAHLPAPSAAAAVVYRRSGRARQGRRHQHDRGRQGPRQRAPPVAAAAPKVEAAEAAAAEGRSEAARAAGRAAKPEPQEVAKPAPPPEPPKVEEQPKEDELALAEKTPPSRQPPPVAPSQRGHDGAAEAGRRRRRSTPSRQGCRRSAKAAEAGGRGQGGQGGREAKAKKARRGEGRQGSRPKPRRRSGGRSRGGKDAADAKARDDAHRRRDPARRAASRRARRRHRHEAGRRSRADRSPSARAKAPAARSWASSTCCTTTCYKAASSRAGRGPARTNRWRPSSASTSRTTGEVMNVRITQPSGDASFDASVERAVRARQSAAAATGEVPQGVQRRRSSVQPGAAATVRGGGMNRTWVLVSCGAGRVRGRGEPESRAGARYRSSVRARAAIRWPSSPLKNLSGGAAASDVATRFADIVGARPDAVRLLQDPRPRRLHREAGDLRLHRREPSTSTTGR